MNHGIKHICFDLNHTLIKENTWRNLNLSLGVTPEEDDLLFKLLEDGVISYKESCSILLRIYKARGYADRKSVEEVLFNYSYTDYAKDIVKYLKDEGYSLSIITGSFQCLADKVGMDLGIDVCKANNFLVFDEGDFLESIVTFGDDRLIKMRQLESICRVLDIDVKETACVGDGDNEELMFERCEHGITFKDSELKSVAWKTVKTLDDLKQIF